MCATTRSRHLLLVEDAAAATPAQKQSLEASDYHVTIVHDGEAAIEVVRRDASVELVLVDIELGGEMDGPDMARKILDHRRRLPVVFVSLDEIGSGEERGQGIPAHIDNLIHYGYAAESDEEKRDYGAELTLSQAQSEARKRYLEAVLRATPNAIVTLDSTHRVLEWNPAAREIFGYSEEEARGREIDELIAGPGGDQRIEQEARDMTSRVVAREVFPHVETLRFRKDGTPVNVVVSGAPIFADGELEGVVAVYTDITERARAQKELAEQRERAEALLREREVLFREAQHRSKNDLSLVRSLLSLEASRSDDPACGRVLEEASNRVAVMSRFHELLFRSGDVTEVNVKHFFDEIVDELRSSWAPAEVSIEVDADDFRVPARVSVSLGIIFNELVTNSLKYGFEAGRLGRISGKVELDDDGDIVVYYSDNGSGFPPEVLSRERGGLGLTILDSLVEQHEGDLDLWNENGARVRVSLKLPEDRRTR